MSRKPLTSETEFCILLVNLLYNNTDIRYGSNLYEEISKKLKLYDISNIYNDNDIKDLTTYVTKIFYGFYDMKYYIRGELLREKRN